jgi:hypothetical protein
MKWFTSALAVALLALSASVVSAQDKYGDAVVQQGELTVIRQGQNLKFNQPNQSVPVFVDDVLRVGGNSSVVLKSRDKATISMGANAVFQVKPFEYQEKKGFARMLFGRFRSLVQGLGGNESMNAKTATAVIGVKGTENLTSVRPRGDTMLVGVESTTTIQNPIARKKRADYGEFRRITRAPQGDFVLASDRLETPDFILIPTTGEPLQVRTVQDGGNPETPIGPNFLGLTLGDGDPISGPAPDEVLKDLGGNLNSPPAGDPNAGTFPGQNSLVQNGLTSQEDLDEGESEDVEGDEGGEVEGPSGIDQTPNVGEQNLDDPAQNLFRGDVEIFFQGQ